jgi:hypothetical protein
MAVVSPQRLKWAVWLFWYKEPKIRTHLDYHLAMRLILVAKTLFIMILLWLSKNCLHQHLSDAKMNIHCNSSYGIHFLVLPNYMLLISNFTIISFLSLDVLIPMR